jgi:transposase-like protein
VRRDIAQWLAKWQAKYPRLCNWVEDNINETLTLPSQGQALLPATAAASQTHEVDG